MSDKIKYVERNGEVFLYKVDANGNETDLSSEKGSESHSTYLKFFHKNKDRGIVPVSEINLIMGTTYDTENVPASTPPPRTNGLGLVETNGPLISSTYKDNAVTNVTNSNEDISGGRAALGVLGNIAKDIITAPVRPITGYNYDTIKTKPVEGYGSAASHNLPLGTARYDPKNFDSSQPSTARIDNHTIWHKETLEDGTVQYWIANFKGFNSDNKPVYVYRRAVKPSDIEAIQRLEGDYDPDRYSPSGRWWEEFANEDLEEGRQQLSRPKEDTISKNSVKYNGLYNKYYSASDFRIYIGDILLDKASGVGINESLSSVPIYTIGNSRYDFLSRGNLIVAGFISINKSDKDYLARVLSNHSNMMTQSFKSLSAYEQMQLTAEELYAYKKKEAQFESSAVSSKSILDWADLEPFTINLVYNNADVVTEGVQQRASIIECRIIGYEHGVDIGSDGQLIDGYKFLAKEVVPE